MASKALIAVVIAVFLYYLRRHMNGCEYTKDTRIVGKVVVITGGDKGLGRQTALDLARRGGKIYLACRSLESGKRALEDIQKEGGVGKNKLDVLQLDLTSFSSVRKFAKDFKERENRLDILVNNAAVWPPADRQTVDRMELAFITNHLGHFLLTHLLVDQLILAAPSRIINVSAKLYENAPINFDDIMGERTYDDTFAYSQSKTATNLFIGELARRLKEAGVSAYSLHPGVFTSGLQRYWPRLNHPILGKLAYVLLPFLKDIHHAAQTTVFCAVEPGIENRSGMYFSDCAEVKLEHHAADPVIARRLWELSADLVKLQPGETHPLLRL